MSKKEQFNRIKRYKGFGILACNEAWEQIEFNIIGEPAKMPSRTKTKSRLEFNGGQEWGFDLDEDWKST